MMIDIYSNLLIIKNLKTIDRMKVIELWQIDDMCRKAQHIGSKTEHYHVSKPVPAGTPYG
jgi:hypothetical protein